MTGQPNRARLKDYVVNADPAQILSAGLNWTESAAELDLVADSLERAARDVQGSGGQDDGLRGETAEAVVKAFTESAASMRRKSNRLTRAANALSDVQGTLAQAQQAERAMQDLGPAPAPYQAPSHAPGYQPTAKEIQREATERHNANAAVQSYNTQLAEQEEACARWVKKLDEAFVAAEPPMRDIHGQTDPRDDSTGGPGGSGPGGPLPTSSPRHNGDSPAPAPGPTLAPPSSPAPAPSPAPTPGHLPGPTPAPGPAPTPGPGPVPTPGPSYDSPTNVPGGPDGTPGGPGTFDTPSAPQDPGGAGIGIGAGIGGGIGAGLLGGGLMKGGLAPGVGPTAGRPTTGGPVTGGRAIGSSSRSASSGALGRGAATGSTTGRSGSGGRGTAARTGATAAGRGSSAGAAGARGKGVAAGARTPGQAQGAGKGAGKGAAKGSAATGSRRGGYGIGGSRTDDREPRQRDSMVFEQDWLDDEGASRGLLD